MFRLNEILKKDITGTIKVTLLFVAGSVLLLSVPLLTQEEFNPESVQPRGCKTGTYKCGMNQLSQRKFEAIPVATSTMISHRGLPSSVDWSSKMPPVGNQGQQGSCVAWASGYAMKSFYERVERKWGYDSPVQGGQGKHVFSPAFIYNQINGGRDQGSHIHRALQLMIDQGASPWKNMPYTSSDYRRRPSSSARSEAAKYKNQSYRRLPGTSITAIKSELARGNLIVFGIPIDKSFYNYRGGVYATRSGKNFGGHALTLVGYNDSLRASNGDRGAFRLINSWGTRWGEKGYGWISYRMWQRLNPQTYVAYDKKSSTTTTDTNDNIVEPQQEEETSENPAAPSNVSASKGTYKDKVQLSWNRVNGAVAYAIGRAPANNLDDMDYLGYSNSTTYSDRKVQPGVAYKYVVLSVSEQQKVSKPDTASIVEGYASSNNIQAAPDQVVGLSANESNSMVQLRWSTASGATKYNIYRTTSLGKGMQKIATSRSNSYTDRRPKRNSDNFYAVSASNGSGEGSMSITESVSIGGQTTPPGRPSGVVASRGKFKSKIVLSWNRVTGADHYVLYRYDYSAKQWQGPKKTRATSFTDADRSVMSGAWYSYAVASVNSAGKSKYSEYVYGKTNPNAQRGGAKIDPPKNLRVKLDQNKQMMELKWDRVKGAEQYYVFRSTKGNDYEFIKSLKANQTVYREKLPKKGQVYFYKMRSKILLGESEDSKVVAAFTNKPRVVAKHRSMPGAGFEKFSGTWNGLYWAGAEPVNYSVEVKGNMGQFTVVVSEGGKKVNTVKGTFASNSSSLVARNFKMELSADVDETALLDFKSGKGQRSIGLSREK